MDARRERIVPVRAAPTHPQNTRVSENIKLARFPAVSALSIPATTAIANVDEKRRNISKKRKTWAPRRWTALVGMAFLYRPMG